jgi:hypothetical protein
MKKTQTLEAETTQKGMTTNNLSKTETVQRERASEELATLWATEKFKEYKHLRAFLKSDKRKGGELSSEFKAMYEAKLKDLSHQLFDYLTHEVKE